MRNLLTSFHVTPLTENHFIHSVRAIDADVNWK